MQNIFWTFPTWMLKNYWLDTDHWLSIAVEWLGDKDGEDGFFFLQRSTWKELSFYLTSDVLRPTLGVLGWMFMTPWMLAGKEILHTRGWKGCHCWQKDCTCIWRVHCICPRWATLARKCVLLPHHPLVPTPTSGLPSNSTVPCKASACFLPFPKMLSCNSPSRCETVGPFVKSRVLLI